MPPKPMPSEWGAVSRWAGLPTCEGISGEARYLRALPCSAVLCARCGVRRVGVGVLSLDARQECVQELLRGAFAGGYC